MDEDYKKQEKRIAKVFPKKMVDISKRTETLDIYKDFLEKNLEFPLKLTGIEGFLWEEFHVLGLGDQKEYEKLKKTRPSYTDIFNLVRLEDQYNEHYGLFAKLTRISDRKRFEMPLEDLKAVDKKSKNYQLLDDYSVWCVNS